MASSESIIRGLLNRGKSVRENIQLPVWAKQYGDILDKAGELPGRYKQAKMYKGNELDDTYNSLVNMLKVADSEAGMEIYERELGKFKADAQKFGGFDDNIVQAETLNMLGNQKKRMYGDFSLAIQDASDFINTDQFLDKADEFVNIQDTIDRLNKDLKAKNKKEHGSVADFLQSELANANALRDNMVSGFQLQQGEIVGANFRYDKAETNDKETFRQLNLYRDRLDLAVKSLAGDGMISPEEAEAIIIGDEKHYLAAKGDALRKAEYNYKANKSMVVKYDGLINTARQKKLSTEDIFSMEGLSDAGKLEMGDNLTAGSWDKVIQQLTNKKGEYTELRNIANQNYKNWYGSEYEKLEGGMSEEEIEAFNLKLKQEQEEAEKVEKEEEKARLEETKQRYEEPEEEEKAKTYSIGEKSDSESLLFDYISGNVSESVLKNIGGQSLLNRARVIKNAYKGQLPKTTVIPGVKTKGITPAGMEYLKTANYKNPGKSGTFSWEDISSEIHSKGGNITKKVEKFLTEKIGPEIRWKWRRNKTWNIISKFEKSGLSVDEFRAKYPKDYEYISNTVANPGGKPYRYK